jgi:predicted nucleic acid-binding protein
VIASLDETAISADVFLNLIENERIGEGEAECIAAASASDLHVCSDDRRARKVVAERIGLDRLLGVPVLLKCSCRQRLISCDQAFEMYEAMRACGAFLPRLDASYFAAA